jgi:hypothetical protein
MSPLPGPVRQIGYVVHDFDAALASWLAAGVGPWYVVRGVKFRARYRGEPCEVTLTIGLANSGDLQVEVIRQDDATPSIYTEFLAGGREGFHQLAWWATDFDSAVHDAQAAGWPVVWAGGEDVGVRFTYVEPPFRLATVFEISELNDRVSALNALIRDAADGWDGSDPVRTLT